MYEHFLYFWLTWILFINVYFFMEKSKKRSFFMGWILLILICTNEWIQWNGISISLSFLFLLAGANIFYAINSYTMLRLLATFSVMISYASLLIWEKITPVWFFMPSYFMNPILTAILIIFLVDGLYARLQIALAGVAFGQLVYELILISYRLHHVIGETALFIHISLVLLFLILMHFIQLCLQKISHAWRKILA